jgi:hypothetical protein
MSNIFVTHLRRIYEPIDNDDLNSLKDIIQPVSPKKYAPLLGNPITIEELLTALNAPPTIDGMCFEFYSANWETVKTDLLGVFNYIVIYHNITPRQEHIVMSPKFNRRSHTRRLPPYDAHEHRLQTSGPHPRPPPPTWLGWSVTLHIVLWSPRQPHLCAVHYVRDMIAHAESTGTPTCIITSDFHNSFDISPTDACLTSSHNMEYVHVF